MAGRAQSFVLASRRGFCAVAAARPRAPPVALGVRAFGDERDVEVKKSEKEFVALLRRIADAVEAVPCPRVRAGPAPSVTASGRRTSRSGSRSTTSALPFRRRRR